MNLIEIENRVGKLRLNDGVHKDSADKLIQELDALYGPSAVAAKMVIGEAVCVADSALESVEVEINSPGGSVFEGQRIYSALRGISARGVEVTTTVNGLGASMGSVILMAGDKRQMTHGSRIMIHEASTIAWGDARTLRKNADLLEGISAEIAGIYAERTGGDEKAIRNLMFAETWMTADQAKKNGFIDTVIKDGKAQSDDSAKNSIDLNVTKVHLHTPDDMKFLDKLLAPSNEEVSAQLESVKLDLANVESANADFVAKLQTAEAALQEAATEIQNLRASSSTFSAELVTAKAENETLTESLAAAEAKTTPEAIQALVTAQIAASGHPPLTIEDADQSGNQGNTITRSEFSALSPYDQDAKLRAGYKITV